MFKTIKNAMKIKEARLILIIFTATLFIYLVYEKEGVVNEGGIVERNGYDGDVSTVYITADIENIGTEEIELEVKNRQYTFQQCEEIYEQCRSQMIDIVLNGNVGFDNISGDLNLITGMEDVPFEFSWYAVDSNIIDENGKIIAHEPGETIIFLTVSYGGWKKEEEFEMQVNAVETSNPDTIKEYLSEAVSLAEEESRTGEYIVLPNEVEGLNVTYTDSSAGRNPGIFLFPIAATIGIIYGSKRDKKKEEDQRKEKILTEYSMVIQKMVMYLSAGMSLRNVWIRIYEDSISQHKHNPIYEEMGITVNELKTGISEAEAYAGFAKRIGIPSITRFTTLITQNLKKGSTNLSVLLSIEAKEAFEERKRRARVRGEQAGTKLLLPMILLMTMVMVIIMTPAFWSM